MTMIYDHLYGQVAEICWKCKYGSPDAITTDEDDFPIIICDKGHCTWEDKDYCEDFEVCVAERL